MSVVEDSSDVLAENVFTDASAETLPYDFTLISTLDRQPMVLFPANYSGNLMIQISSIDNENHLSKLYPVSIGMVLTKHFSDFVSITPIGHQGIKVLFDFIKKANTSISLRNLVTNGKLFPQWQYIGIVL